MKIMVVSLGCDKNLVDTEKMLSLLEAAGHTFTDEESEAEVILVNTCCFIGDAKEESVNTILEMAEYKKSGSARVLLVAGCMAQRYKDEILQEIPEVDGILGTASYDKIVSVLDQALQGEKAKCFQDISALPHVGSRRIVTTGGYYSYLKIAEGVRQALYLLHYPRPARSLPKRTDGRADRRSDGIV